MNKLKNLRDYDVFREKKNLSNKTPKPINEATMEAGNTIKVKTVVDIPISLINAYAKKVKDAHGKDIKGFFGNMDVAEEIVKYVLNTYTNVDAIAAGALTGDVDQQAQAQAQIQVPQGQPQGQPQAQSQVPQGQPQAQSQVQPQGQPAQAQSQVPQGQPAQAQSQVQVRVQGQDDDEDFEDIDFEDDEDELEDLPL